MAEEASTTDYHSWVWHTQQRSRRTRANARSGRQIVELQTSVGMLTSATANGHTNLPTDPYGRQPFHHPATEGVEILNKGGKQYYLSSKAISNVARQYGLQDVVRWQPKDASVSAAVLNHFMLIIRRWTIYPLPGSTWSSRKPFMQL